jgi:hypothetical protein
MRKPFEKLVHELLVQYDSQEFRSKTFGGIALELEVSIDRIQDALDAIKMLRGHGTYVAAREPLCQRMMNWHDGVMKCMNPRWAHQGLGHEFQENEELPLPRGSSEVKFEI